MRWVACTAVVRSVEHAGLREQLGRGQAVAAEARVVLGHLLGEVDVQRRLEPVGPVGDQPQVVERDGPDRVDRRSDDDVAAGAAQVSTSRPRPATGGAAVGEPQLHALGRRRRPGGQVAGVQQRDPHPASRAASTSASPIAFGSS